MSVDQAIINNGLKVGDTLYRYVSAFPSYVFRFEVICCREYKNRVQYHLKCLSCKDHEPCEILVSPDDHNQGAFKFIQMLNNDDDECNQKAWHVFGELFYKTRKEALIEVCERVIKEAKDNVEQSEQRLKNARENLVRTEAQLHEIEAQE